MPRHVAATFSDEHSRKRLPTTRVKLVPRTVSTGGLSVGGRNYGPKTFVYNTVKIETNVTDTFTNVDSFHLSFLLPS